MHVLLEKVFNKMGIKSIEELQGDEKASFDRWNFILTKEEVNSEQIREFCVMQRELIEGQFDIDNTPQKTEKLVLTSQVYKKILGIIEGPKAEREALIKDLTRMIDT